MFKTQTREQLRLADKSCRKLAKLEEQQQKHILNRPGSHKRELNPHFADGGSGLPDSSVQKVETISGKKVFYDSKWLKKALQRAKDTAEVENRSLEDVAKERWGGLDVFYKLLKEAEWNNSEKLKQLSSDFNKEESNSKNAQTKSANHSSQTNFMLKPSSDDEDNCVNAKLTSRLPKLKPSSSGWKKSTVTEIEISDEIPSSTQNFENSRDLENRTNNEDNVESKVKKSKILSAEELNKIAAKITKAELIGDEALVKKLKKKLESNEEAIKSTKSENSDHELVVLSSTDKTGFTRPVSGPSDLGYVRKNKKLKAGLTHDKQGNRLSYFADDHRTDLKTMFEKEKNSKISDEIASMKSLSTHKVEKLDDYFDVDEYFEQKVAPVQSSEQTEQREARKAVAEHQRNERILDSCHFCCGNKVIKKHLIVAMGTKCYVSVPHHESMVERQCYISPIQHVICGTQADEDVWLEINMFRNALVKMFETLDEDCVFFETATHLNKFPHMVLNCIPMPKETGELSPIYFKKAIQECEEEWASNKKLVELKGKSITRAIPKGLPYFWVDFGMTPGFAHVVENERTFPSNFAQEIIGGMLEADYFAFRKPKPENFENQKKKVLKFLKEFSAFDPTKS